MIINTDASLQRRKNWVLVANKVGENEKRVVTTKEGEALALRNGMRYCETDAKSGYGVEQAFYIILTLNATLTLTLIIRRRAGLPPSR